MREFPGLAVFNRGLASSLALARVDQKRIAYSAEIMTNWRARVLGPMSLRAGLGYIGTMPGASKFMPFVFATETTPDEVRIVLSPLEAPTLLS